MLLRGIDKQPERSEGEDGMRADVRGRSVVLNRQVVARGRERLPADGQHADPVDPRPPRQLRHRAANRLWLADEGLEGRWLGAIRIADGNPDGRRRVPQRLPQRLPCAMPGCLGRFARTHPKCKKQQHVAAL